jgi:hypothetical protein
VQPKEGAKACASAECCTLDQNLHRVAGSWRRETKAIPYADRNGTHSENDLSILRYGVPSSATNSIENWAEIDSGLASRRITIFLHDVGERSAIDVCKVVRPDSFDPSLQYRFEADVCRWRQDASQRSDRELDGPFGFDVYPVVIDDLGSFAYHLKRRTLPGAGLAPISFDGVASTSGRDPTFKLKDALLAGTYPFSEVVWLTLDPLSLGNDRLYQVVWNLMHGGAGDAYRGHVAFLSDMTSSGK